MNSETCVQALRAITEQIQACAGTQGITELCERYKKVLVEFVSNRDQDFPDRVAGLRCAVAVFQLLRPRCVPCPEFADRVAQTLFLECARVVLGVEFHRLADPEEPRASFTMAVTTAYQALLPFHTVARLFHTLLWLMQNYWSHPTLVGMMKGDELEPERALAYLREGEFPELVRLRIAMLVEGGCDNYALNLANWCVQSSEYAGDVFIRQTQLLLLHKLAKLPEFYNQCTQLSCCTAVKLLLPIFCVAQIETHVLPDKAARESPITKCGTERCCMGAKMVECLFEEEDKRPVCLILAQTFLLQDWMTPHSNCCTRELLRLWMLAQRLAETDNEEFLNSVTKVAQIARSSEQLTMLAEAMQNQFPNDFLSHKTEICLRAMKSERHRLDSARVKKEDDEADSAADGLAKTCRQLARFYEQHYDMCLSSLHTALYLDPKADLFFMIESLMQNPPTHPSVKPADVDEDIFKELWDLVETLRPSSFHPRVGWDDVRRTAIFHLENAGFQYDEHRNKFYSIEQQLAKTKPMKRKVRIRSKKKPTIESEVRDVMEGILRKVAPTSETDSAGEVMDTTENTPAQTDSKESTEPTQPTLAPPPPGASHSPGVSSPGEPPCLSKPPAVEPGGSDTEPPKLENATKDVEGCCPADTALRETGSEDSGYHCECSGVAGDGVACGAACTKHKDSGYSSDCSNITDSTRVAGPVPMESSSEATKPATTSPQPQTISHKAAADSQHVPASEPGPSPAEPAAPLAVPAPTSTSPSNQPAEPGPAPLAVNPLAEPDAKPADTNGRLLSPKMATTLALMNGQFPSAEPLPGEGEAVPSTREPTTKPLEPKPFSDSGEEDVQLEVSQLQFLCSFCDKPFNTMAQRRRHQEWVCSKMALTHTCPHCHKSFSNALSLTKHIAQSHKQFSKKRQRELANVKVPSGLKLRPCTVKVQKMSTEQFGRYRDPHLLRGGRRTGSRAVLYNLPGVVKKFIRMTRPIPLMKKPKSAQSFGQAIVKKKLKKIKEQSALKAAAEIRKAEMSPPAVEKPVVVEAVPAVMVPEPAVEEVVVPTETTPVSSPVKAEVQPRTPSTPGTPGSTGDEYLCPYCKINCNSRTGRIRHIRHCEKNPNEVLICEFCEQRFLGLASLNSHYLARHTPGGLASLASLRGENSSGPRQKMKLYKGLLLWHLIEIRCNKCDKVFSNKMHCTKHQKGECDKEAGMRLFNSFMCKYCEERFTTQVLCWEHTQKCTSCPGGDPGKDACDTTFKCEQCDKRYVTEGSLRAHILTLHEEIYPQMLKRNRTGADAKAIKKLESAVHKLPGVKSDVIHDSLAAVPDNKEDPKKAAARPRPPRPRPTGKKLTPVTQRNQQTIEKIAQEYQKSGEKEEGGLVESGGDTAQPAADDLPGLSVAEMEQAMTGIPNVDGFLKLLEDDTPIDSHWDLVESFQGNEEEELEELDEKAAAALPDAALKTDVTHTKTAPAAPAQTEKSEDVAATVPSAQTLKVQAPTGGQTRPMLSPGLASPASSSAGNVQESPEKGDLQESQKFMIHKNAIMLKVTFFSCTGCKQDFEQKPSFDEHLMSCASAADAKLHTQKRYQCLFCSAEFESAPQCRRHQRNVCLPGIGIDAEAALNAHFCCDQCSRKFFVKHALKKHMHTDHGIADAEVSATHNLSFLADELKDKLPPDVLDKLPLEVKKRLRYVECRRRRNRPYKPKPKVSTAPTGSVVSSTPPIDSSPHSSLSPAVASVPALSPRMTTVSPGASRESLPQMSPSPHPEVTVKTPTPSREPHYAQFVPSQGSSEPATPTTSLAVTVPGPALPAALPPTPQAAPLASPQPVTPLTPVTSEPAPSRPAEPTAATPPSAAPSQSMATLCVGGHMIQVPLHVIPTASEGQSVVFRAQVIAQVVQLTAVKECGDAQTVSSMGTLLLQGGTGPQLPVELVNRPPAPPPPPPAYPGREAPTQPPRPPRPLVPPSPVMSALPQGPAPVPRPPTTTAVSPLYAPQLQQHLVRKPLPRPARIPVRRPKTEPELVMDSPALKESKEGVRKILQRKSSQEEMATMEAALVQSAQDIKAVLQSAQAGADSILAAAAGAPPQSSAAPTQGQATVPATPQGAPPNATRLAQLSRVAVAAGHLPVAVPGQSSLASPMLGSSLSNSPTTAPLSSLPEANPPRAADLTTPSSLSLSRTADTVSMAMDTAGIAPSPADPLGPLPALPSHGDPMDTSPGPQSRMAASPALQINTDNSTMSAALNTAYPASHNTHRIAPGSADPPRGNSASDLTQAITSLPGNTPMMSSIASSHAGSSSSVPAFPDNVSSIPASANSTGCLPPPQDTADITHGTDNSTTSPSVHDNTVSIAPIPDNSSRLHSISVNTAKLHPPPCDSATMTVAPSSLPGTDHGADCPTGRMSTGSSGDPAQPPVASNAPDSVRRLPVGPPGPNSSPPWPTDLLPDEEEVLEMPLKRRRLSDSSLSSSFSNDDEDILETAIRCIAPGPVPLKTLRPPPQEQPIERIDRYSEGYSKLLEKLGPGSSSWTGEQPPGKTTTPPAPSTSQLPSETVPGSQNAATELPNPLPKQETIKMEPGSNDFPSDTTGGGVGPPGSGAGYAAVQAMQSVDRHIHDSVLTAPVIPPKLERDASPAPDGHSSMPPTTMSPLPVLKLEPSTVTLSLPVMSTPLSLTAASSALASMAAGTCPLTSVASMVSASGSVLERQLSLPPVQQLLGLPLPLRRPASTPPGKPACTPPLTHKVLTPPPSHAPSSTSSPAASLPHLAAGLLARAPLSLSSIAGPPLSLSSQPVTMLAWSSGGPELPIKQGLLGLAGQAVMSGSPAAATMHTSALQSVRHLISLPPTPSPTPSVDLPSTQTLLLARSMPANIGTPPLQPMTPPAPVMSPLPSPQRPLLISPPPYMSPTLARTPPGPGLLSVTTAPPTKPTRRRSRSTSQSRSQTPQSRSQTPQSVRSHTPAGTPPLPTTKGLTPANSPGASTCTSGSLCSSPPPELPKPDDGRISPIVDALLARIKAKTKELEDKKLQEQEIRQLSIKNRKRSRSRPSTSSQPGTLASSPLSVPSPPIAPISPSPDSSTSLMSTKSEEARQESEEITCDLCWRRFVSHEHLAYHSKFSCPSRARPGKSEDSTCPHCHAPFHQKVALKMHLPKCVMNPEANAGEEGSATAALLSLAASPSVDTRLLSPGSDGSPEAKKKAKKPLSESCKENLKKTMERKTMCHAVVKNPSAPSDLWVYECRYCGSDYLKLMSLHSHILSRHPEMYRKFRVHKDEVKDTEEDITDFHELPQPSLPLDPEAAITDSHIANSHLPLSERTLASAGLVRTSHVISIATTSGTAVNQTTLLSNNTSSLPSLDAFRLPLSGTTNSRDVSAVCANAPTLAGMLINSVYKPALIPGNPIVASSVATIGQPALSSVSPVVLPSPVLEPASCSPAPLALNKVVEPGESLGSEDEVPRLQLDVEEDPPELEASAPLPDKCPPKDAASPSLQHHLGLDLSATNSEVLSQPCEQSNAEAEIRLIDEPSPTRPGPAAAPLVCHLCEFERQFPRGEYSLKCHLKWVHGQDLSDTEDLEMERELIQIGDAPAPTAATTSLTCPLCPGIQRTFDRPFRLQHHLRAVHGMKYQESLSTLAPVMPKSPSTKSESPAKGLGANGEDYHQVLDETTGQITLRKLSPPSENMDVSLNHMNSVNSVDSDTKLGMSERPIRATRLQKPEEVDSNSAATIPPVLDNSKLESTVPSRLRPQRTPAEPNTNNDLNKNGTMSLRKRKTEKPAEEEASTKVTRARLEVKGKTDLKVKPDVKGKIDSKTSKSEPVPSKRVMRNLPAKNSTPQRSTLRNRKR